MYDFRLAQIIYEERLREAEERRRYRRYAEPAPPLKERLLQRLGDYLLAIGSKLKAWSAAQASSVRPVGTPNG